MSVPHGNSTRDNEKSGSTEKSIRIMSTSNVNLIKNFIIMNVTAVKSFSIMKFTELLKALYDFTATDPKTLSFKANDQFINLEKHTNIRKWWRVIDKSGHIGCIPCNYVTNIEESSDNILNFLDACTGFLKDSLSRGTLKPSVCLDTTLKELEERRQRVSGVFQDGKEPAPRAPPEGAPAQPSLDSDSQKLSGEFNSVNSSHVLQELPSTEAAYGLIQQVRRCTGLSYELSREAVRVVLAGLGQLPSGIILAPAAAVANALIGKLETPFEMPSSVLDQTHDACRLRVVLEEIAAAKDDDQQRSWMLHEDEQTLSEYLIELHGILRDADNKVCVRVMESTEWEGVMALLQFYQMECRWSIRQLLLRALSAMCALHKTPRAIMLTSVLPMELARDMQSNPNDLPRLLESANLLTMIFSTGQPMPVTHLEQLGVEFATFLLNYIEQPPACDTVEQLPDVFLRLLLSLNLQFADPNENVLLQALAKCTLAQSFTEKSLLLFNREEDPVQRYCSMATQNHSVLKLFIDLFSGSTTAQLFYTNDTKVLVDIIARQLADLSPGDERRGQYLKLCRLVLRHSGYEEHGHRKEDLRCCLQQITGEEGSISQSDQALVRVIVDEFPVIFGN